MLAHRRRHSSAWSLPCAARLSSPFASSVVLPAWLALACILLATVPLATVLAPSVAQGAEFGDPAEPMHVDWYRGRIIVGVLPRPNEGYLVLAQRILEDPTQANALARFNGDRPVMAGVRVKVPLILLKPALRGQALHALAPEDELTERGWSHRVENPVETLIQLTEAYTGSKARFRQLAKFNNLKDPDNLRRGTEIVIPLAWIPDALGLIPLALKPPLELEKDAESGEQYARYVPQAGETLYSLILRFTDRERAEEINRMSRLLAKINHLRSESAMQAGRALRIPLTWISEDYLNQRAAPGTAELTPPRRAQPKVAQARPSSGKVHVIVDPGHGGSDAGAVYGSRRRGDEVYEHVVVYDISLRTMAHLRARGFAVYPTLVNPNRDTPVRVLNMSHMGHEVVPVNPPYKVTSARVGVNMRIYLIDAIYRDLTERQGVAPEDVVLVSVHGDALAPTLRGAMVYFPDHRLRRTEFGPRGRVYRIRNEAVPTAIYYREDANREAQDLSQGFATEVVAAFRNRNLGVSQRRPVRSYYYRNGERTLPGVLRYSRVPVSVLVEVANLNNAADRQAVLRWQTREEIAQAIADAVSRHRQQRRAIVARASAG